MNEIIQSGLLVCLAVLVAANAINLRKLEARVKTLESRNAPP
ncbi:hypothetical protein [uncultured Abyssibacter sp.]